MKDRTGQAPIFERENYKWMLIGLGLIVAGMFLMAGGKSPDPAVFEAKSVYSTGRITIAPLLILAGLIIQVIAIFRKGR